MGTKAEFQHEQKSFNLKRVDALFMFSDGIIKLFNKEKERYGISRLISVFKDLAPLSSHMIVNELEKVISSWSDGNLPEDDITLPVVKMR